MPKRSSKPPRDPNQLAAHIVALTTGQDSPVKEEPPGTNKNPAAVALGRLGGLKGGKARAANLTSDQRKTIAQKAAQKRWANKTGEAQTS